MNTQKYTEMTPSNLDFHKRLWVDISIQNRELNISKNATHCSVVTKESEHTWRKRYYTWKNRLPQFEELWHDMYYEHYKSKLAPKLYERIYHLIEKENDLSKLVRLLEVLEGKGNSNTQSYRTEPLIISEITQRKKEGLFSARTLEIQEVC